MNVTFCIVILSTTILSANSAEFPIFIVMLSVIMLNDVVLSVVAPALPTFSMVNFQKSKFRFDSNIATVSKKYQSKFGAIM